MRSRARQATKEGVWFPVVGDLTGLFRVTWPAAAAPVSLPCRRAGRAPRASGVGLTKGSALCTTQNTVPASSVNLSPEFYALIGLQLPGVPRCGDERDRRTLSNSPAMLPTATTIINRPAISTSWPDKWCRLVPQPPLAPPVTRGNKAHARKPPTAAASAIAARTGFPLARKNTHRTIATSPGIAIAQNCTAHAGEFRT
jgi:hypothetical protein